MSSIQVPVIHLEDLFGDPASYSRNIQVDERRRKIVRLDQVGVAYVERRRGLGVAYIEMKRAGSLLRRDAASYSRNIQEEERHKMRLDPLLAAGWDCIGMKI